MDLVFRRGFWGVRGRPLQAASRDGLFPTPRRQPFGGHPQLTDPLEPPTDGLEASGTPWSLRQADPPQPPTGGPPAASDRRTPPAGGPPGAPDRQTPCSLRQTASVGVSEARPLGPSGQAPETQEAKKGKKRRGAKEKQEEEEEEEEKEEKEEDNEEEEAEEGGDDEPELELAAPRS